MDLGCGALFFYVSALLFYHSFVKGQVSETDMSDLPFVIGPPIVLITTVVIFLFGWLGVGWKKGEASAALSLGCAGRRQDCHSLQSFARVKTQLSLFNKIFPFFFPVRVTAEQSPFAAIL